MAIIIPPSEKGSESQPCTEDYRGPTAFSEPETQVSDTFIQQYIHICNSQSCIGRQGSGGASTFSGRI